MTMSIKNTRLLILACVLGIVIIYFANAIRRVSEPATKSLREDVSCLTALCLIDDQYGTNCLEMKPRLAHIVLDETGKRMSVQLKAQCEVY